MQTAVALTQNDWTLKNYDSTSESGIKESNDVIWDEKSMEQTKSRFIWDEKSMEQTKSRYTSDPESTSDIYTVASQFENRIIRRPKPTISKGRFILLQQWEGAVLNIYEETFTALIYDQTNPQNDPEEVDLLLEEVSPQDRPLLQEGAIFYWSIGYDDLSNGQRKRSSNIRFRRLPAWSKKDIDRIMEKASALNAFLRSECSDSVHDVASR